MRFATMWALWTLLAAAGCGVLFWWSARQQRRALERAAAVGGRERLVEDVHPLLPGARRVLFVVALVLLGLGLARPQIGSSSKLAKRTGIDLLIALDVSKSMTARDVRPDRLRRAKLELQDLADHLKGDRIGLVVFSGAAFVQCPLTTDYAAFKTFLASIEPGIIPVGGTNLEEALRVSRETLESGKQSGARGRVVVLITDGEGTDGDALAEAKAATEAGILIYTVGIGSATGEPIPDLDEQGNMRGYRKDRGGATVMSRLDEATLRQIADTAGGKFVRSNEGGAGVVEVGKELENLEKAEFESKLLVQYDEKFQWLLGPAFLFLAAATFLPERRRRLNAEAGDAAAREAAASDPRAGAANRSAA